MCAMSPRLLRPRQAGFDPRTISGLALWLDASAADSLYTTDTGPVTAVSSPLDISGCKLWLDASHAPSLFQSSNGTTAATASGDPVGYWGDRSGSGTNCTQATSASRPALSSTLYNGIRPVLFDGGSDHLLFTDTSIGSVFCVLNTNQAASVNPGETITSLIGWRDPNNPQGNGIGIRRGDAAGSNTSSQWNHPGNVGDFTNPAGSQFRVNGVNTNVAPDGSWHIVAAIRGSTAYAMNCIGAHFQARELSGQIAEMICYDTALSSSDRARVELYLANRWGISGVYAPATAANDQVGYWRDRSGSGKHATQATANNRPTIAPASRAGKNVIRFDGLDDVYSFTGTAVQTIFAVVSVNTQATRVLPSIIGNSSGSPDIRRDTNAAPTTRYRGTAGDGSLADAADFAYPSGSQFRINGAATPVVAEQVWHIVTAIRGTGTATVDRIGRALSTREFGGDMAEIICYDRALTDSERIRVEQALARKWGISLG